MVKYPLVMIFLVLLTASIRASPGADTCGIQNLALLQGLSDDQHQTEKVNRIVGGTETKPAQYPWMVSITRKVKITNGGALADNKRNVTAASGENVSEYYRHICGGSLITKDWVMTAAHCLYDIRSTEEYLIRIGIHASQVQLQPSRHDQTQHPTKIILHYRYVPDEYAYDIGLIKLSSPIIKFTTDINTVCMSASGEKPFPYTNCTVTGWGRTHENSSGPSDILREVEVEVLPNSKCPYMLPATICAGVLVGGSGPCMGDSGGPLVYALKTNGIARYFQAGIVSFGEGCARPNAPGVYTDVGFFWDWIKSVIDNN